MSSLPQTDRRADDGLPDGWASLDVRGLAAATSVLMLVVEDLLGDQIARGAAERIAAKTVSAYLTTAEYFAGRDRGRS